MCFVPQLMEGWSAAHCCFKVAVGRGSVVQGLHWKSPLFLFFPRKEYRDIVVGFTGDFQNRGVVSNPLRGAAWCQMKVSPIVTFYICEFTVCIPPSWLCPYYSPFQVNGEKIMSPVSLFHSICFLCQPGWLNAFICLIKGFCALLGGGYKNKLNKSVV